MDTELQDRVLEFALIDLPACYAALSLVNKRWHHKCSAALRGWCADNAQLDQLFRKHIPYPTAHSGPPDFDADEREKREYERRNHVCWQDIAITRDGRIRLDIPAIWVNLSASRPGRFHFRLCLNRNGKDVQHYKFFGDAKALCSINYWWRIPISNVEQELARFNHIFSEPWFSAWAFRIRALRKALRDQQTNKLT